MLLLSAPAWTQTPATIVVQASGELPGFEIEQASSFLAAQMDGAGVAAWQFVPGTRSAAAPNRVEWNFDLLPYAGGEVRRYFPMPEAQNGMDVHLQGTHRLITAEAKLYLDGQYQTAVFGQQAVQGGAGDPDLKNFIAQMTRQLESGYRAIDMTQAVHAAP